MKKSVVIIAGVAVGLTAAATAQSRFEPRQVVRQAPIKAQALDTETDLTGSTTTSQQRRAAVKTDNGDPNLRLPFQNVARFHERMQCEDGETKRLIVGGVQDNFAQPQDPYIAGQNTTPYPNTNGYDGRVPNRHFWDRFAIPTNISKGYMLMGLRSLDGLITTDSLGVGDRAAAIAAPGTSNDPWFSSTPANLPTSGFQVSGNVTGAGANYLGSLANLQMSNNQSVLQSIQGNSSNPLDVFFQDDTSVDYVAFSVCEKKTTDAVLEPAGCAGKDSEMDSKYGPGPIKEYCEGDPILFSTAGTTPADNYFVGLATFDPMIWEDQVTLHPGAWTCNNGTCPPPAYLMPADYNTPSGQSLPANAPGEVYHFKFAVGPTWDSESKFFRVVKCADTPISGTATPARIEEIGPMRARPMQRR